MGALLPLLVVAVVDLVEEDERGGNTNGPLPLWRLEAQPKRRFVLKKGQIRKRGRRARGPRRPMNVVEKRVRTLRSLVPRREPMGLDGLFRETADYIMSLETRVRLMQIMVQSFTAAGGSDF